MAVGSYSSIRAGAQDRRNSSASSHGRRSQRHRKDSSYIGNASWLSSVINLVNTIIGAGILAMPLALSHMGILLGTLVILFSAFTAGFGLYLQTRCARYLDRGSASFFALSQITYPNAAVVFDAAIAIKCFGVGVSYLIIIGDLMPGVVRGFAQGVEEGFLVDRHFWVTVFMLIVIPLSFLRRLDSLKYTSVVALLAIGYLVILVVYHFAAGDTMADRGPVRVLHWQSALASLSSFPVIVFAYTCHQNMFSILNEITDNRPSSTTSAVVISNGIACFLYILVAVAGYLSYGDTVGGNIVGMYLPSVASTIAKAAIVIMVLFSYPLQVHPCRASIEAVLRWKPQSLQGSNREGPPSHAPLLSPGSKPVGNANRSEPMSEGSFATITTAIVVLSYIAAMTVSSLEKVLAYVGSTGSTTISFILPGLFYYKISSPDSPHHQRLMKEDDDEEVTEGDETSSEFRTRDPDYISTVRLRSKIVRNASMALAIYGFVVMITCLITNTFFVVAH